MLACGSGRWLPDAEGGLQSEGPLTVLHRAEGEEIAVSRADSESLRSIVARLERSPSTIGPGTA